MHAALGASACRAHQRIEASGLHQLAIAQQEDGGQEADATLQQAGAAEGRRPRSQVWQLDLQGKSQEVLESQESPVGTSLQR